MLYYYVNDKNVIGKTGRSFCDAYIYVAEKGWVRDTERIISDRLIGYDNHEIGCTDMLERIEEISEAEAKKKIEAIENKKQNGKDK